MDYFGGMHYDAYPHLRPRTCCLVCVFVQGFNHALSRKACCGVCLRGGGSQASRQRNGLCGGGTGHDNQELEDEHIQQSGVCGSSFKEIRARATGRKIEDTYPNNGGVIEGGLACVGLVV